MSMTISSMVNTALLSSVNASTSAQATARDPITKGLNTAGTRIAQQLSSTNVQISAFGQIKSGFASLQTAGNALSGLSKTAAADDVKKSAQAFVDAFNSTNKAVLSSTSNAAGSLANNGRAITAGNDLRSVVTSGDTAAALKKVGITVAKDGSLALDSKAFDTAAAADLNAVKGTLSSIGAKASQVATKELTGNVASAVSTLESRAKNLASQQAAYSNTANSLQASQQQFNSLNNASISAISSYMNIFSS